jgi:hypothetical protein
VRQRLFRLVTAALVLLLPLIGIDLLLRAQPRIFGDEVGNQVFSRYGTGSGDMYFPDASLDMRFMWADFETRAYFNGWFWSHETDGFGFRNPAGRTPEILLVGDSLVYGHGVEPEDTASEVLHERYGWNTYNLSQQGDSLYQSYVKIRLHLEAFAPEAVILFAFLNDPHDLEQYRGVELLDAAPELRRSDYAQRRMEILERGADAACSPLAALARTPSLRFVVGRARSLAAALGTPAGDADPVRALFAPILDPQRFDRITRYYDRVLADLAQRTRDAGVRLVVVHLDFFPADRERARVRMSGMLRDVTARQGIPYLDTGALFRDCDDCVLEHDGHLSAEGNAMLARFLEDARGVIRAPASPQGALGEPGSAGQAP